jgi:hypothetical protein
VDILKQHLKTSVRNLKLGHKWVFQMYNDAKHTSKVVAKCLKDNKVKWLCGKCVGRTEKACAIKEAYNLTQLHQLCQDWVKIQLNVGSLWKNTRNIRPKLNNLKAMLPNTNRVYVNFWPIGNVMK